MKKSLESNGLKQSGYRWRKAYEKDGLIGLTDTRKSGSGRPLKRELTPEEVIEKQAARIQLLEGQVELLKKLDATERRLLSSSRKLSINNVFQLISNTLTQFPFKRMVTYFCELLNVSRSGYYSFLKAKEKREVREQKDLEARDIILKAFNRRGYKKGARSIKMTLEQDYQCVMSRNLCGSMGLYVHIVDRILINKSQRQRKNIALFPIN
ncbi:hypothetical protein LRS37_03425 [Neobacillus sedimentimangrovi]|uniref:Transposase n=1 Tax=Neobacillus sedimentimangrovi TaxID=2699460 RepID=A0ABS8QFE0_9BACI|nr:hypothetical protein [Neobacillus sedimentimangrovi]